MSHKLTVIRLPGAGMISNGPKSSIPWLAYREQRIDSRFYERLIAELARRSDEEKFVVISGGLGSHLYMNLARDLGLSESDVGRVARHHIRELQEIVKLSALSKGLKVHATQVSVGSIQREVSKSLDSVFFVDPSPIHSSTDDLAADVAKQLSADRLIYFKSRAPHYTVGFEVETKVSKWKLDDLMKRAKNYEEASQGSYVLSGTCLDIIKTSGYEVIILPPEATDGLFGLPDSTNSTVIER